MPNPKNPKTTSRTDGDADAPVEVEQDQGGGFYADSPSDGPNRRGPDTDDASDDSAGS